MEGADDLHGWGVVCVCVRWCASGFKSAEEAGGGSIMLARGCVAIWDEGFDHCKKLHYRSPAS